MVQSIDSNVVISPQDMHHKVMLNDLFSCDKDSRVGLSKAELDDYISQKEFSGAEVPEFAKKLAERFAELDQNKDGNLSEAESASLVNNRGMWQINQMAIQPQIATAQGVSRLGNATGLLHNNILDLAQKGLNYVKNNPQIMLQAENLINKIM